MIGVVIMFGKKTGKIVLVTPVTGRELAREGYIHAHSDDPLRAFAVYDQAALDVVIEHRVG